jgi:hypothetical protein
MNIRQAPMTARIWPCLRVGLSRLFGPCFRIGIALLFSSQLSLAQFSQQGPKLVGRPANGASQGISVALSADGNTAIVGGPFDNVNVGAAWVYTRNNGAWTQQSKLVDTTAAHALQGWSVALSADGNTAIVGGPYDNGVTGAAWVWTRNYYGAWTLQQKLVDTAAAAASAQQGSSVALSADGATAVVGGPYDNSGVGAAWVWTRNNSGWTRNSKLVDTSTTNHSQGWSVALSGDGRTALVGALYGNSTWIYNRGDSGWTPQGTLVADDSGIDGAYVALSADGNTAIVGVPNANSGVGAAWIYTRNNGVWQPGYKLDTPSDGLPDAIGNAVGLSADGNTAITGGPTYGLDSSPSSNDNDSSDGAAWVYFRSNGGWTTGYKLNDGTNEVGIASLGLSVAISGDGNTVLVGGPWDHQAASGASAAGATWVYVGLTVALTAQSPILVGQSSLLNWSTTNATSCTASGWWRGDKSTGPGHETVTPPIAVSTFAYTLTCNGVANRSVAETAYVTTNSGKAAFMHAPCDPLCLQELEGAGGRITPYGQVATGQSGGTLLTKSGTIEAVEVSHEGNRNITTITVSADSTIVVSGDLGDNVRIVKGEADRSRFLVRLRTRAFGAASWTRLAAGAAGANQKFVGASFYEGRLRGLILAPAR